MSNGKIKRLRTAAYNRQQGRCFWCGRLMLIKTHQDAPLEPRRCTADRRVSKLDGGRTNAENIVAACLECNNSRRWQRIRASDEINRSGV